jgi:hypothetical protein
MIFKDAVEIAEGILWEDDFFESMDSKSADGGRPLSLTPATAGLKSPKDWGHAKNKQAYWPETGLLS